MNAWLGYDMSAVQCEAGSEIKNDDRSASDHLISYAEADIGVVYVIGRGFWDDEMIDRHFVELRRTAAFVRRSAGCIRVLVDLRGASVQSPEVAVRIKNETRSIWTENDKIAVVLQSTLARLQINRVVDSRNHASFIAVDDARRWLGLRPRERLELKRNRV